MCAARRDRLYSKGKRKSRITSHHKKTMKKLAKQLLSWRRSLKKAVDDTGNRSYSAEGIDAVGTAVALNLVIVSHIDALINDIDLVLQQKTELEVIEMPDIKLFEPVKKEDDTAEEDDAIEYDFAIRG